MIRRLPLAAAVRPLLVDQSCGSTTLHCAFAALSSSASLTRRSALTEGKKVRTLAHAHRSAARSVIRGSESARSIRHAVSEKRTVSRFLKKRIVPSNAVGVTRHRNSGARRVRRRLRSVPILRVKSPKTSSATSTSRTHARRSRRGALLKLGAVRSRRPAASASKAISDDDSTAAHVASRREELRETDARIAMRGLMSQYFRVAGRPVSEENLMRRRKAAELCKPLMQRSEWKNANTLARSVVAATERCHPHQSRTSNGESRVAPERRMWSGSHCDLPVGAEAGPVSVSLEPPSWGSTGTSPPSDNTSGREALDSTFSDEFDDLPDYGALDVDEDNTMLKRRDR